MHNRASRSSPSTNKQNNGTVTHCNFGCGGGGSSNDDLEEEMRYTEYHADKAVIKDKLLLAEAMEKMKGE